MRLGLRALARAEEHAGIAVCANARFFPAFWSAAAEFGGNRGERRRRFRSGAVCPVAKAVSRPPYALPPNSKSLWNRVQFMGLGREVTDIPAAMFPLKIDTLKQPRWPVVLVRFHLKFRARNSIFPSSFGVAVLRPIDRRPTLRWSASSRPSHGPFLGEKGECRLRQIASEFFDI